MNPRKTDARRTGGGGRPRRDDQGSQHGSLHGSRMDELCKEIVLAPGKGESLSPDLFDRTAEKAARFIAGERTKNSQLRRFYDELLRWDEKVNGSDPEGAKDRLREHLPFIRMMNAKAAYAKGRDGNLVGESFVTLLRTCLAQVSEDPAALRNCRLFFEAFMGFYKLHGKD